MNSTWRRMNGVLLLDKAKGVTSNRALQQVRRLYQAKKAGHTGILDPLAQGLLPVCFGEATKFAQYLLDADKAYVATLKFGEATTTGDAEGDIIATLGQTVPQEAFQAACQSYVGARLQTPPMYSALKHEGKPLYEYARQGVTIERQARAITVYAIDILSFDWPVAVVHVRCSKGTYIRTLAEDLAKCVGQVAHLTGLNRVKTAGFTLEQAHSFDALQSMTDAEREKALLPCDALVQHLPSLVLPEDEIKRLEHGQSVPYAQSSGIMSPLRGYDAAHRFIGLIQANDSGCLKALRLMQTGAGEG